MNKIIALLAATFAFSAFANESAPAAATTTTTTTTTSEGMPADAALGEAAPTTHGKPVAKKKAVKKAKKGAPAPAPAASTEVKKVEETITTTTPSN